MAKPIQYCKVINLQLNKFIFKKRILTDLESQTQLKFSLSLIRTDSLRQIISPPTVADLFFWAPKSLQMVIAAMILKDAYSLEGKL